MAIKRCRESFAYFAGGAPHVIHAGELFNDDDPVVTKHPTSFEDVDAHVSNRAAVEQATAAPGEKRSVAPAPGSSRSRKTRKVKPDADDDA